LKKVGEGGGRGGGGGGVGKEGRRRTVRLGRNPEETLLC
jgi:hypothetical protein